MRKFLKFDRFNTLTLTFISIIIGVTVLAFTVALSLGYYNINSAVNKIFNETVENDHSNIVTGLSQLNSRLNLTTYQIINTNSIQNISSDSSASWNSQTNDATQTINNLTSDYVGLVNMFIVNTSNNKIFSKNLGTDISYVLGKYISKDEFIKLSKERSVRNYTAPNDENYIVFSTYDFRGFAIAYIFEKTTLFDSVCKFNFEPYETAVYYKDTKILSNSNDKDTFPNNLTPDVKMNKLFTYSRDNYTIITNIDSSAMTEFYKPFIKQIIIFTAIILLIGIIALIFSVLFIDKTSESYINNLLSHSQQHQYTAIKSTIQRAIRNQFLQQNEEEFINDYFEKLHYKQLYCRQIRLDHLNTLLLSFSYKNIAMYMQKIKLIIEDKLSNFGTCIIIDIDFDSAGIIIATKEDISSESIDNSMQSARDDIEKLLSLSITVAKTSSSTTHDELIQTFTHLGTLMKYRFFTGHNSNITDNDEISMTKIYPIAMQQQMITYLLSNEKDKFTDLFNKFFDELKTINCDDARKWVLDFTMALLKHYPSTEGAVDIISQMSQAEVIEEQYDILKNNLIKTMNTDHDSVAEGPFTTRANDIIEAEYANLDFNLSSLAESLGINPVYAGKKFKKEFDKSFTTYLAEFRIHKAVELLRNVSLTSAEIAEKCGFASSTYFVKTFKKITNMTPTEYKKKL